MNKTYNATSFIELHQRNQSKMNHKWKYSNLQYYTDPTIAQDRYLISSIQKKVKTFMYLFLQVQLYPAFVGPVADGGVPDRVAIPHQQQRQPRGIQRTAPATIAGPSGNPNHR